ncbi:MAG: segregation and condensation protein A [Phycisphaerales bacterium]|jgi:segregation and condensation protein A
MDLLLYLIRKSEVEIEDIQIAQITNQYLSYVEEIDRIDIELAGEFLVMAATLMEIKSRMIRPPDEDGGEASADAGQGEDRPGTRLDPRAELVRQLLEYKKHRDGADALERRQKEWSRRFPAGAAGIESDAVREAAEELGELELEDLDLLQLMEAYKSIVASVNFDRLGDHEIISDDTPIELHAADIVDRLTRAARGEPIDGPDRDDASTAAGEKRTQVPLAELFRGRTRPEMVGLFLAILTLVRDQRVGVKAGEDGVGLELREEPGDPLNPELVEA